MTTTSAASGPSTPPRVAALDTLRGFALLGILITNVVVVSTILTLVGDGADALLFDGPADRAVLAVVDVLFLGKFFLLFSFLFGYSFTLQLTAAARAGAAPVPRLLRRSAVLFAIGLAHAFLLWFGDILTLYAALCLILVLLRNVRPRTAALLGGGLLVANALLALIPGDGADLEFLDPVGVHEAYTGGPLDTLSAQLTLAPEFMAVIWTGQGPQALGMFLLGLAAGKLRLLDARPNYGSSADPGDPSRLRAWLPRLQWTGLLAGGAIAAWSLAAGGELPAPGEALRTLTNPLVTFAYAATVLRLAAGSRLAAALAPAGRMAATNYIAQSLVFALIYTGYGLALVDRVPPLGVVMIALATYACQLIASACWLKRHPYGPVEWLMRAVTNAKIPPWRSSRAPGPPRAAKLPSAHE